MRCAGLGIWVLLTVYGCSGDDGRGSSDSSSDTSDVAGSSGLDADDDDRAVATAGSGEPAMAMDECGLQTGWPGDEYCILPPPPDQGFQIHIGPSDYDNPEPEYILQPGEEVTERFSAVSGNESDVHYYFRQYRMRPGSHHLIVYAGGESTFAGGRRLGGTQNAAKDNPAGGVLAPENEGLGMELEAQSPLSIELHYINYTDEPIIKEAWVNFWYRDPSEVEEPAIELFSMSPMNVEPGKHVIIHGSCPISEPGRVLTLYGHRHANNLRFSAWRVRGNERDLLIEDYDWQEPMVLEFSSLVENPVADPEQQVPGGWSGILDLEAGDTLDFECEIINATDRVFRGLNEALDDEMCILIGDTAGTRVPFLCDYTVTEL